MSAFGGCLEVLSGQVLILEVIHGIHATPAVINRGAGVLLLVGLHDYSPLGCLQARSGQTFIL